MHPASCSVILYYQSITSLLVRIPIGWLLCGIYSKPAKYQGIKKNQSLNHLKYLSAKWKHKKNTTHFFLMVWIIVDFLLSLCHNVWWFNQLNLRWNPHCCRFNLVRYVMGDFFSDALPLLRAGSADLPKSKQLIQLQLKTQFFGRWSSIILQVYTWLYSDCWFDHSYNKNTFLMVKSLFVMVKIAILVGSIRTSHLPNQGEVRTELRALPATNSGPWKVQLAPKGNVWRYLAVRQAASNGMEI